jgi:hypothetical protein
MNVGVEHRPQHQAAALVDQVRTIGTKSVGHFRGKPHS